MKVMLINDNANLLHAGCQAVSDAIAIMIGSRGHEIVTRHFLGDLFRFRHADSAKGIRAVLDDETLAAQIDGVDAVICNGEGSIHHGAGTELLAVLGAAQQLGKQTLLFNAVFEETQGWDEVLQGLQDFVVREHLSAQAARACGARQVRVSPDICLEASFQLDKPLSLGGQTVVTDWHPKRLDVGNIMQAFVADRQKGPMFYLPFHSADTASIWQSLPSLLSDCRVLVTGRHHGAYMAACCGCPFVLLPSNTHKMEGIRGFFPDVPVCRTFGELGEAVDFAVRNVDIFVRFAHLMASFRPLDHFTLLGGVHDPDGAERERARLKADLAARTDKFPIAIDLALRQRSAEFFGALP